MYSPYSLSVENHQFPHAYQQSQTSNFTTSAPYGNAISVAANPAMTTPYTNPNSAQPSSYGISAATFPNSTSHQSFGSGSHAHPSIHVVHKPQSVFSGTSSVTPQYSTPSNQGIFATSSLPQPIVHVYQSDSESIFVNQTEEKLKKEKQALQDEKTNLTELIHSLQKEIDLAKIENDQEREKSRQSQQRHGLFSEEMKKKEIDNAKHLKELLANMKEARESLHMVKKDLHEVHKKHKDDLTQKDTEHKELIERQKAEHDEKERQVKEQLVRKDEELSIEKGKTTNLEASLAKEEKDMKRSNAAWKLQRLFRNNQIEELKKQHESKIQSLKQNHGFFVAQQKKVIEHTVNEMQSFREKLMTHHILFHIYHRIEPKDIDYYFGPNETEKHTIQSKLDKSINLNKKNIEKDWETWNAIKDLDLQLHRANTILQSNRNFESSKKSTKKFNQEMEAVAKDIVMIHNYEYILPLFQMDEHLKYYIFAFIKGLPDKKKSK